MKSKVAKSMDGKKLTDTEKKSLIDKWWSDGGYKQMEINSHKVCSASAMYSRVDALAHIVHYFYNLPLEKQWKIYSDGAIEHYLTRALAMEVKSSTSAFYTKYRRPLIRERELTNTHGEIMHGEAYELSDGEELEGKMKCLRYFYDNELNMIDKWLVEERVFKSKTIKQISEEFNIEDKDVIRQWNALKQRLIRTCKSY